MSLVNQIVQQAREKKARREAAIAAVMGLPLDERRDVLADLIMLAEAEEQPVTAPKPQEPPTSASAGQKRRTYVDRAEALILASPNGLTTTEIARAIGQAPTNADGTLRQLLKRGTVERRDGKWYPVSVSSAPVVGAKPKAKTLRGLITEVLTTANTPLGATDIFNGLVRLKPDAKRPSVDAELVRMRHDKLLVQKGVGANNGGLFVLANGGAQPAV